MSWTEFIYQVDVTNNFGDCYNYYLGLRETTFKERYGSCKTLFNNEDSKNSTELSKYFWSLKENGEVVRTAYTKIAIYFWKEAFFYHPLGDDKCLNKKTEFINKCRHQNKLLLKNVKDSMD